MLTQSTRGRLMASTIIFGAALAVSLGGAAQAQGTATAQPGNAQAETTENAGQGNASTRVVGNSQGQNEPGGGSQVGEVVVTGSRIARRDYVAASPIVSVGPKALEATGSVTVDTLINQLPAFTPSVTSSSNNPSNGGQANIDLRGLGNNRTLVLLDGRRVTPSNSDGTVDVNTIPAALIENIEIVTGGQSAAYGSDAIAGVVNFKLKRRFQGAVIDGQYGITERGDGQEENVSATIGGNFNEDRGNAVISFAYSNRDSIFNGSRPFSAVSGASGTTPYGAWDPGANGASQAAINTVFGKYGAAAGAVTRTNRIGFNPDGTLFAQKAGGANYKGDTTSPDFATIPTLGTYNTGAVNLLQLPLTRYNFFSRGEYNITPHMKFYLQGNFTNYQAATQLAPSPAASNPAVGGTGFLVPVTNPFIPTDLATLLASRPNPAAPFIIRDRFTSVGPRLQTNEYDVYQLLTGISGDFPGFKDWTYDLYGSYGRVTNNVVQSGNISHGAARQLLEAPDGGRSLCAGGFNPFGNQPISDACKAYIGRLTKNATSIEQRVVEGNIQGGLFDLPAGRLKFAVGADYRSDRFRLIPDNALSGLDISANVIGGQTLVNNAPSVVGFNAQNPLSGSTDVYELYGEVNVPIVRDLPFVKSLEVNAGYRFSEYNIAGNVNSYRADAQWQVVDFLRIRGGYSRSVRAPAIGEFFLPASNNFPAIGAAGARTGDPCDVTGASKTRSAAFRALCVAQGVPTSIADAFTESNTQIQSTVSGNPSLQAETADTYTIGAVFAPKFNNPLFSRVSASIDYFNIEVSNAIASADALRTLQKCFNIDGSNPTYTLANPFCALITRDPATGSIVDLNQKLYNQSGFKTTGIDFQVDWAFGLGAIGLDDHYGSLAFNVIGTYLDSFDIQFLPGGAFEPFKGTIGNTFVSSTDVAHPEWKLLTGVTYSYGPVDLGFRWRHLSSMVDASGDGTGTPSTNYFDANLRWRINDTLELRTGVNNLTDELAPTGFTSTVQANTDPSTFDVLGRRYYVALKARF